MAHWARVPILMLCRATLKHSASTQPLAHTMRPAALTSSPQFAPASASQMSLQTKCPQRVAPAAAPGQPGAGAARGGSARCRAGKAPDRGFFSDVDPNAEVLPVKSNLAGDITQRSKSRWESDFIWNKDWAKQLDFEESLRKQQQEGQAARQQAASGAGSGGSSSGKGFLSLTSKVDLNSMDVDLSAQLRVRKKSAEEAASSAAAGAGQGQQPRRRAPVKYGSVPPTRVEQRAWERSGKFSRKVVAVQPANETDQEALAAKVEAERRRYEELKTELQAWAAGLTVVCLAATYTFYGRDVAASYGVGALGGLLYLRLLNRSIDGVGAGIGGALGQPRLLIPVILALGYNRYNSLVSEQTGLTLQLLPMLLGFFTYKGAVVAKQSLVLFGELTGAAAQQGAAGRLGSDAEGQEGEAGGDSAALDVASVDRAFRKKMLNEI